MDFIWEQKHFGKTEKDGSIQTTSVTIRPIYKEKIDYYGFLANCLLKFPAEFSAALQSPEKWNYWYSQGQQVGTTIKLNQ